jgi:hypothetical protein
MNTRAVLRWKIRMELFAVNIMNRRSSTMNLVDFAICDITLLPYRFSEFNRYVIKSLYKLQLRNAVQVTYNSENAREASSNDRSYTLFMIYSLTNDTFFDTLNLHMLGSHYSLGEELWYSDEAITKIYQKFTICELFASYIGISWRESEQWMRPPRPNCEAGRFVMTDDRRQLETALREQPTAFQSDRRRQIEISTLNKCVPFSETPHSSSSAPYCGIGRQSLCESVPFGLRCPFVSLSPDTRSNGSRHFVGKGQSSCFRSQRLESAHD